MFSEWQFSTGMQIYNGNILICLIVLYTVLYIVHQCSRCPRGCKMACEDVFVAWTISDLDGAVWIVGEEEISPNLEEIAGWDLPDIVDLGTTRFGHLGAGEDSETVTNRYRHKHSIL